MTVEITGLNANTTYDIYIGETCLTGNPVVSSPTSFTTQGNCVAPQYISYSTNGKDFIEVYWESYNPGASYTLEYNLDGNPNVTEVTGTSIAENEVLISNLQTESYYDIALVEDCGGESSTVVETQIQTTSSCVTTDQLWIQTRGTDFLEIEVESQNYANGNSSGGDDAYYIEYGPSGFTLGQGTEITGLVSDRYFDVTLNNLVSETEYQIYVTEDCDAGSANYSYGYSGRTISDCEAATSFQASQSGIGSVELRWESFHTGQNYTIEYGTLGFTLGTGTTVVGVIGNNNPEVEITNLTSGSGYEFYLTETCSIGGQVSPTNSAYITNLEACPQPASFIADNATFDAIELEIESKNIGFDYTIVYGESGFTPAPGSASITGTVNDDYMEFVLDQLSPDTDYDLYLTIECPNNSSTTPIKTVASTDVSYAAPANDECTNAISLSIGPNNGTTLGATGADRPTCNPMVKTRGSRGTWFTYTPGVDQNTKFDLCNPNNDFDTQIELFSGSCANLICEKAEDDDDNCENAHPNITTALTQNETYFVYVSGYSLSDFGDFALEVSTDNSFVPCGDPENIQISNVTSYGAVVTWESPEQDEEYGLYIGDKGWDLNNGAGEIFSTEKTATAAIVSENIVILVPSM